MKPQGLKTRIFLDSGDPKETREALSLLGFLDGQTTNPSLIAKNPETAGKKFGQDELLGFYRKVVEEVSSLIPDGSVSIEVYADASTKAETMLEQGRSFYKWIPNAHIKFPTTAEGLKAAEAAVKEGIRVNMTLVFSQQQAAAVYAATCSTGSGQAQDTKKGDVFLSPFVGRLDDRGENGMEFIANVVKMYQNTDHHVEILAASVRSLDHFLESIQLGADIITAPLKVLKAWVDSGLRLPDESFAYHPALQPIPYQEINLDQPWQHFNIKHELTDKGIEKFAQDWNALIKSKA